MVKELYLFFKYLYIQYIRSIFCYHNYEFYQNIYGDEIIYCNFKRSIWCCSKCGKFVLKDELFEVTKDK